jgi:Asp-tRNA(Asn)/Glu-tRNA(Gln) amidotransferase A subunit family amidase
MKTTARKTGLMIGLGLLCFASGAFLARQAEPGKITVPMVRQAQQLLGLNFSTAKIDSMLQDLEEQRASYIKLRQVPIPNRVPPAMTFNPIPVGFEFEKNRVPFAYNRPKKVELPQNREDLAFYTVAELAELIRTKKISSEELTRFFLERLKTYSPKLLNVTTLTEELALRQARQADQEIKAGKYRGPLHGIPYGAKDLLSTRTYKTTWGSVPYKDQLIDADATVIKKLEAAGAVLVAKTTLGELAWGDVWYGGMTRTPWDISQGSSGSSAGSGSAVAAGLLPFAIGTETWGSIVSPATVNGVTGLRPTYGRVSRDGAMALSWSMDKIGPMARSVEDCALVFNAILGPDGVDQTVYDVPFNYHPKIDLKRLRVGYLKNDFERDYPNKAQDQATLEALRKAGVELIPMELPKLPANDISFILSAEAAAAFDDLTRSGRDSLMVRQIRNAWPTVFRAARFIPAVEYIQAQRARTMLIAEMHQVMKDIDLYVAPSFAGRNLLLTNLTGHPCVVVPNGFTQKGMPTSITFIGRLFGEGDLLSFVKTYQDATDFHRKHPKMSF